MAPSWQQFRNDLESGEQARQALSPVRVDLGLWVSGGEVLRQSQPEVSDPK